MRADYLQEDLTQEIRPNMANVLKTIRFNEAPAWMPSSAMVLAAGLGTRMMPITATMPKALVRVHGKALIDHALDALKRAGVGKAVVNVHHCADQMEQHLAGRTAPQIAISNERERLLDSGGGVVRALPLLGDGPFFVLNADTFWIEGYRPNLVRMAEHWDGERMDVLLLLSAMTSSVGYRGAGDFNMGADGRLIRRSERHVAPFAYAGAAIFDPAMFADPPGEVFSLNALFDRALERERLFGIRLDGLWLHVGTPEAIGEAEEAIARSAA